MTDNPAVRDLYLDLLQRAVLGLVARSSHSARRQPDGGVEVVPLADREDRIQGRDWPVEGDTMVGQLRLDNLRACVEDVLRDEVPGDLIEAGVWRGGAAVLMRGVLAAYGVTDRKVWLADSFAGLPEPDAERFPLDHASPFHTYEYLAVSEDEVRDAFVRYGLLDEQVRFLPGWFRDTLPSLASERFALIRLDGDLYESTMLSLEHLYPRLSAGGYAIVDDYGGLPGCRRAVDEYRERHGIVEPVQRVDWTGVFWRKA